jgi:hypothetical protein
MILAIPKLPRTGLRGRSTRWCSTRSRSREAKHYGVYHCLSTFLAQAVYLPGSWDFRIRSTESIVFQLRVVAGAPKSLSIWPR